ncbi:MAG: CRTAC1 family protein [Woeseiaceae bacterium]
MQEQEARRGDIDANTGFRFVDKARDSWIRFRHRVTDDTAITYKAVHYANGSGISVADIDGDGNLDILFVNQVGANELWRNIGNGRFVDITDDAGIAMSDRISVGASFADIDNDGDPDLYITAVRQGNQLFENNGDGTFSNISARSGLQFEGHSSGAVFFDFDRDGLLDVYLTNVGQYTEDRLRRGNHEGIEYTFYNGLQDAFSGHKFDDRQETNRLYRNTGDNVFIDVTERIKDNQPTWSGDATIVDFNEDGWPDIYALNMQGNDEYYVNRKGKSFERLSREVFRKTSWGAMGIKSFDWNNDGDFDLYITDKHSDMSSISAPDQESLKSKVTWDEDYLRSDGNSVFGNTFFDNDGKGGFREISDDIGVENFWPWGLSVGDINADGYQDIFVTASMNYPFRYQTNFLLINEQGKRFSNAEFLLGIEPRAGRATARPWFGLPCGTPRFSSHSLCDGAEGAPVEVWGALGSRASVIFDLDNDGDLDIVTNEFNSEPMVLVSSLADQSDAVNFLSISLQGKTSNRDGIGARVVVNAGDDQYVQRVDAKSGYLSHSLLPLYFGIADHSKVDTVTVYWPSGQEQTVGPFESGYAITITEPK